MTQDAAEAFLMGGGGPKSIFNKYDRPGTVKGGTILSWEHVQQRDMKDGSPKFWPKDGQPMMQLVVTLQTDLRDATIEDDTGLRRLFVKGYMTKAVREAIKTADRKMLEQGGQLWVRYDGDDVPAGPGLDGAKMWSATYVPAPLGYGSVAPDVPTAAPVAPPAPPVAPAPPAPPAPPAAVVPPGGSSASPHADEAAAVAALAAQGLVSAQVAAGVTPAGVPQAATGGAVVPPAAPVVPPVASGPPPGLAAALAALSPEERAAMGLPPA